jgi:hypothetical protein
MSRTTMRRREVLAAGLAAGTGALLLGRPAFPSAAAAAPSGEGSTGDGGRLAEAAEPTALPPAVLGARMIGLYGTAFYTVSYDPADTATVVYVSGKGASAGGSGERLFARIPVEPGARIVRVDYYGFRDTSGQQRWWLTQRDPTTFLVEDLFSDPVIGAGALTTGRTTSLLVLPGYDYSVTGSSGESGAAEPYVRGAVVQYLPAAGAFLPITPRRVYDSRVSGGRLTTGIERTISVARELSTLTVVVPAGAVAVAANVTVDQTVGWGWLSARPASSTWSGTSTLNWTATGTTIANGTTCSLGGDRQLTLLCGGAGASAHVIVDVVGYYL